METICILNGNEQFLNNLLSEELDNIIFQNEQNSVDEHEPFFGHVLVNKMETDFKKFITLLLKIKNYKQSIIWIFSERKLTREEETILMKLEANFILSEQSDSELLILSIKNFLSCINKINIKEDVVTMKKKTSDKKIFLNIHSRSLVIYDEEIELTNTEYLVLAKLFESNGNALTYESLSEEIIDGSEDARLRISNIIFHIRGKIKKNKFIEIKNIRSIGYRLIIKKL